MMVKAIGDSISMSEYNSLVYLLRKFKKIVRHEKISKVLETDIGTLNITSGFVNVGENFILENDVNIISQNCLPLTTYSFTFYIINADTSGAVLETPVTLSGDTDKYGNLEITIPENLLSTGEEIRREIKIDVTFQEHEGVSPTRLFNLNLNTDKKYIGNGETATVTATLIDTNDEPLTDYTVYFDVNGIEISKITNSDGEAVLTFTGTGDTGVINIKVLNEEINIIDYYFYDPATYTEHNSNYRKGKWNINYLPDSTVLENYEKAESIFCPSSIPTVTDISQKLEFDTPYIMEFDIYYSTDNVYLRVFNGNYAPYTIYFNHLLYEGHYKLIVKEDIIQLWVDDTLIEEVIDVDGATSVGFVNMKSNTVNLTVLEFANLIIYQHDIIEPPIHAYNLSLTGTNIIESDDMDYITCTLLDNDIPVSGERLYYIIKHGDTIIQEGRTDATDSNGQTTIVYYGEGIGDVDVIVSFGSSVEETFTVQDCVLYRETLSTNITDLTLPTEYKLEFDIPSTSNSSYAIIGTDNTHRILVGQISNQNPSLNGVWIYNGSSTPTQNNCPTSPTQNAHYTFTYENGAYTMSNGQSSISGTVPAGINMQKLLYAVYTISAVRNYKIKAI